MARKGKEYFDKRYFAREEGSEWRCVAQGSNPMGETLIGVLQNSSKGLEVQFEDAHQTSGIPVEVLEEAFSKPAPGTAEHKAKHKKADKGG